MGRNRFQLIADLLEVGRSSSNFTRLMYKSGLSYQLTKTILGICLDSNLIVKEVGNPHTVEKGVYTTTNVGLIFVKKVRELEELLANDS